MSEEHLQEALRKIKEFAEFQQILAAHNKEVMEAKLEELLAELERLRDLDRQNPGSQA